jgi:hypothetical protein
MVLAGFADVELQCAMVRERPYGEADHVVWSVPPEAAAGLVDRGSDWADFGDTKPDDK